MYRQIRHLYLCCYVLVQTLTDVTCGPSACNIWCAQQHCRFRSSGMWICLCFPTFRRNVVPSSSRVKQSNMNCSWSACSLNTRKHPTVRRHIPKELNPQYLMQCWQPCWHVWPRAIYVCTFRLLFERYLCGLLLLLLLSSLLILLLPPQGYHVTYVHAWKKLELPSIY